MLVFISYAQKNIEEAKNIDKYLREEMKLSTFLAKEDIKAGQQWKEQIFNNLKKMDLFIPLRARKPLRLGRG